MDITRQKITELADERRYIPQLVETTVRLLDILDAFAADDVVSPRMALKGGTALNAFHLPLPRLSFDIDINYVGEVDWSAMMNDKPAFESRVISIMESKNYRVQNAPPQGRGKWTFRCAAALGGETSLHVDFNYQARAPIFDVQRISSAPFGDYRAHDVPVLDVHEVIGGKLNALATRVKGRDLFDANTIVDTPGLDLQKIRLAGMVYGMTNTTDDWRTVTSARIDGTEKDIRDSLLPCLPDGYFDAFGGIKAWLDRSIEKCRRDMAPMYEFNEREMAFMNTFLDEGRLDASLLDAASNEVREAIQSNPVLHRIGKALEAGRFTITSAPEKQRRREDMELQLACALTERIAPSPDDEEFHRKLGKPVRDALAAAGKTVGVSQAAVDDVAAQIARARAEADLRVDLTREFSRLPLHESRARFEGHPRFSRGDIRKPYDAAIKEKMKELDRKGVIPTDLEQVVARALVVSEGTRNADTAQKMAKALSFGTVPAAEKIRTQQQALLAEMAQPREDDSGKEKIRLAQRLYRCLTFVEIRQICDGRGPLLKTLKSEADRAQVASNFKALHSTLIAGPAPWVGVHREVALTLGMRTEGAERSGRFPTASM